MRDPATGASPDTASPTCGAAGPLPSDRETYYLRQSKDEGVRSPHPRARREARGAVAVTASWPPGDSLFGVWSNPWGQNYPSPPALERMSSHKRHTLTWRAGAGVAALLACTDTTTLAPTSTGAAADVAVASAPYSAVLESVHEYAPRSILTAFKQFQTEPAVQVWDTGLGSALAAGPTPGTFWAMTDRGPNVDYPNPANGKLFPAPDFAPRIVLVRAAGNRLHEVRSVPLSSATGTPLTGFPLPVGTCGATGEKGYFVDADGTVAERYDARGIDSEGLAVAPNGDFWVSDEYGPFIARFDAAGRELARYAPCGGAGVTKALPAVFARRRANRGMEGLTLTPGGTLVGMMQSPLDNPRSAGRASRALRVLMIDPSNPTAPTRQFVYLTEASNLLSSEILAVDEENFLVLERDGNFPGDTPGAIKRIYKASVRGPGAGSPMATDESDPSDSPTGRSYGAFGATLEAVTDHAGAGIVPLYKTLVVDLVADLPGYPHDRPEGIALIGSDRIAIGNDDDFGVGDNGGILVDKLIPGTKRTDFNSVWIVRVSPALR